MDLEGDRHVSSRRAGGEPAGVVAQQNNSSDPTWISSGGKPRSFANAGLLSGSAEPRPRRRTTLTGRNDHCHNQLPPTRGRFPTRHPPPQNGQPSVPPIRGRALAASVTTTRDSASRQARQSGSGAPSRPRLSGDAGAGAAKQNAHLALKLLQGLVSAGCVMCSVSAARLIGHGDQALLSVGTRTAYLDVGAKGWSETLPRTAAPPWL